MKSIRLDAALEKRLREAARISHVPESLTIWDAIALRCDPILGDRPNKNLGGVIGSITSKGGHTQLAHRRFGELIKNERSRKAKSAS